MIVDGKKIAQEILDGLKDGYEKLPRPARLGVVMAEKNSVTDSFVRIKERTAARLGAALVREEFPEGSMAAVIITAVEKLSRECDGIIVQLPLSAGIAVAEVLAAISPERDVDGICPSPRVLAPVVGAIQEILTRAKISIEGKKVAVVGHGTLVGAPAATWFRQQHAKVMVVTDSMHLAQAVDDADIIVLGVGSAGILKPEMMKDGGVILDAGTSEEGGEMRGDADPRCADKASIFTPVPGGIGPIAVAMIFKNLLELIRQDK